MVKMFDWIIPYGLDLNFRLSRSIRHRTSNRRNDKAVCPDCGQSLRDWYTLAEEVAQTVADGMVYGAQRIFIGECPTHGTTWATFMGHHSSVGPNSKKELQARYRKARDKISAALSGHEQDRFKAALLGLCRPSDDDLRRWDELRDA